MRVDPEILRTMDYVNDASCRTSPQPMTVSKDYQRDKEYIGLDYSDMEYREVYIEDDEF